MKPLTTIYLIYLLLICISNPISAQGTAEPDLIETEAIIQEINFKIRGRRSSSTATVRYKTLDGDSLVSKVKLMHIPFIGSLHNEGDRVKVLYDKKTPLLLTTESTSFIKSYGLYILILLGIIIVVYRFIIKPKKISET